jgi:hypothetical protein
MKNTLLAALLATSTLAFAQAPHETAKAAPAVKAEVKAPAAPAKAEVKKAKKHKKAVKKTAPKAEVKK